MACQQVPNVAGLCGGAPAQPPPPKPPTHSRRQATNPTIVCSPIPPPPLRMTLIGGGPGVSVLPPTMGGIRVSKEEEEILAGFMDEVLSPAG